MTLTAFTLSGQNFRLRRAGAADVGPIIELLAADELRQDVDSADPEHRGVYLEAFRRIDADPAQLLVVVADEQENVVATMQLTTIPGLALCRCNAAAGGGGPGGRPSSRERSGIGNDGLGSRRGPAARGVHGPAHKRQIARGGTPVL